MATVTEPSASLGSSSEDELILLTLITRRKQKRRLRSRSRTTWTKSWLLRRQQQGLFNNLLRELNHEDPEQFRLFHRVDRGSFQDILKMVGPVISKQDTDMRSAIQPSERLALTLRFLATGETFRSLSFQFRIGERTISNIVEETCVALFEVLKKQYLQVPSTEDDWAKVATEFHVKWNYPFCIGAIDGKHIAIKQPENSGSEFYNYKHFFSVLLLAIVDANYKFIYVDVGAAGRAGDAGVFNTSGFKHALDTNTLNLPKSKTIEGFPGSTVNFHLIGDDAFPMSRTLLKPYPHRQLDKDKKIFNYRLSRARRVVENAFGILANRFRVFLTTINLSPDKVVHLILASCCLHNYLVVQNKHTYTGVCDVEDVSLCTYTAGAWRNDPTLTALSPAFDRNPSKVSKEQRQTLTSYFSSDVGSVPWQDRMITLSR